ncbi:MAG: hypothetical protein WC682_05470 [Parcubacteria group bacterium]
MKRRAKKWVASVGSEDGEIKTIFKTLGIVTLILISSCSFKKPEEVSIPNKGEVSQGAELKEEIIDSTGDGISDKKKIEMGLNPNIAYFPKLSVALVKEISLGAIFGEKDGQDKDYLMIGQKYAESDSPRGGDLDFLKVLRKKIMINQYNFLRNIRSEEKDTITKDDLGKSILSNWTDSEFYNFKREVGTLTNLQDNTSGKFKTNFTLKIHNAKNVSQISKVKLKSFYFDFNNQKADDVYSHYLLKDSGAKEIIELSKSDNEYLPLTNYYLFANEIKSSDLLQRINERHEVGIEFEDFDYSIVGVDYRYSIVMTNIIEKCAKIIISDLQKTEIYYVAPYYSLLEALTILGKNITQNKDGTIDKLDHLQTNISQPISFDSITSSDLSKGVWSIFGQSDNLSVQLMAKGTYLISYATMKDLLDSSGKKELKISEQKSDNPIVIDRVNWGDEVTLKIDSLTMTKMKEELTEYPVKTCNELGANCFCSDTYSLPVIRTSHLEIDKINLNDIIIISDEYGNQIKADLFSYNQNVILKFNYPMPQLLNKINIDFAEPLKNSYRLRKGRVSSTCPGFKLKYSNDEYINKYELKYDAKIIGILKY